MVQVRKHGICRASKGSIVYVSESYNQWGQRINDSPIVRNLGRTTLKTLYALYLSKTFCHFLRGGKYNYKQTGELKCNIELALCSHTNKIRQLWLTTKTLTEHIIKSRPYTEYLCKKKSILFDLLEMGALSIFSVDDYWKKY